MPSSSEKRARSVNRQPAAKKTSATTSQHGADFAIVGLGASAGGLDVCKKLLLALPAKTGMAFILIQHLDPTHESMMVDLLSNHTQMNVHLATEGMLVEQENLYLIPPGRYLAIRNGALHLSDPTEIHGARLPFDFFLHSLAQDCKARSICVVLSGSGGDGSLGLQAIKESGGYVIAQSPDEADYAGMPESAIKTGTVDLVLPITGIAEALVKCGKKILAGETCQDIIEKEIPAWLAKIIDFLRLKTPHHFEAYKLGTLQRRIERRITMLPAMDPASYLDLLHKDPVEMQSLVNDLFINVTGFFRDQEAFAKLANEVIPELLRSRSGNRSLRIWVAGCSTGEEAYSVAMICVEAIADSGLALRPQVFASDVDADAITVARNGIYPKTIEADVSPERLAHFFTKEDQGYRLTSDLRGMVVFTVQDLLVDPPFSRLDMVSCRNLLIYLRTEDQEKILRLFHFALRDHGILFLGSAESTHGLNDLFKPILKHERIYRRIGGTRPIETDAPGFDGTSMIMKGGAIPTQWKKDLRHLEAQPGPGDIARRLLVESYAPASVLINDKREVLYYSGTTDRYLQLPFGEPTKDVLAMARSGLKAKLVQAINQAASTHEPVTVAGALIINEESASTVNIRVLPVRPVAKGLLLVSFIEESASRQDAILHVPSRDETERNKLLEQELEAVRTELEGANRDLVMAREEERALSAEAMSVNEEYQSTNEELLTSKEELQSLNEELTALNNQLQEMLERQRNTSNDLQNILDSSSVATLFLDSVLNIRFFTPAAKVLFHFIATDIGRPLADLAPLSADTDLLNDAKLVLETRQPVGREVRVVGDVWSMRRILPYLTKEKGIEGVVITYADISEVKAAAREVELARAYSDSIIATILQPLVVLDDQSQVVSANSAFYDMFSIAPAEIVGRRFTLLNDQGIEDAGVQAFIDGIRDEASSVGRYEVETVISGLGPRRLLLNATKIRKDAAILNNVLLAIDDITERISGEITLENAKQHAETANLSKSRFLAAASHDLRQPLQTMSLIHGLLAIKTKDPEMLELVARLDGTISTMSGILNTLLDINQLESGTVHPEPEDFPINDLLLMLQDEFKSDIEGRELGWHVVPCAAIIHSDRFLLVQMIRNLVSNAAKYTQKGKILMGCRRRGDKLRIEIWDTGIGIMKAEMRAIFNEFYQLDNPARERNRGLGLGLAIVRRLGNLLGHRVDIDSRPGRGSVFSIEVPLVSKAQDVLANDNRQDSENDHIKSAVILIVEDDPEISALLELSLGHAGYHVLIANDSAGALAKITANSIVPNLIIADYNLPGPMTGLEIVIRIRGEHGHDLPAIIMTGDISTSTLEGIGEHHCICLNKPVKTDSILKQIRLLLPRTEPIPFKASQAPLKLPSGNRGTVFVIDDEPEIRKSICELLESSGWTVETYENCETFLAVDHAAKKGCILVDAFMQGMGGLEFLECLKKSSHRLPAIMITGKGDIGMAVRAMKAGALDFIEKPVGSSDLLLSIDRAFNMIKDTSAIAASREDALARIAKLTPRQRQIMEFVLDGHPSKNIAADLGISQRTVENHRAVIMEKMGANSIPALIRVALAAY